MATVWLLGHRVQRARVVLIWMTSVVANLPEGPQFKIAQGPETNIKIRLRKQLISLQFTHVRSFACRDKLRSLRADGSTVGLYCVTITWI